MKKLILIFMFISIFFSYTIANANYVYKNKEYGVDFIIPVLNNYEVNNNADVVSWQFLTKEMKNKGCAIKDSDLKTCQEEIIKGKYTFALYSLDKNNEIANKIYVKLSKSIGADICTLTKGMLEGATKNAAYELYKEGYKQNKTFCGSRIYFGTLGRDKSFDVILSNGTGYGIKAAAGRLGRRLEISGYSKNSKELDNTLKAINFIFTKADFDATYPDNYFNIELEGI